MKRPRTATIVAMVALGTVVVASLAAPLVAAAFGHDPADIDLLGRFQPPSGEHPLGTDR
jgi:hypothetical protein